VTQPRNNTKTYKDRIDISNDLSTDGIETTINSNDAIDMVSHSSEFILKHLTDSADTLPLGWHNFHNL